ncbi:MAG: aspartate aminotransferase family protein [Actinomycetes bacterium]|jgi:4-aminobutyrate aminotransferase|nr:MAG: aspartate aminotransferase family protein [Actinomycetota bacterium]
MTTHAELLARHRRVLPDWMILYYREPIALVDGEGRYVWDAEGRKYLDFFGGILVTMSGHKVPEVVDAIKRQADRLLHSSTLYLIESQIALAEKIAALSGIPDAKVFFTNSGTEANDAALMIATQLRGSNQVLAFRGSYHGRSHSTVGVTGQRAWSATSLSPFHTVYVHGPYRLRSPFGHLPDDEYTAACVRDLEEMIAVATSGQVAAMIAEPIQGVGGFATPPDGFLGAVKEVTDRHDILFISDEVQTGWGRTGENFWGFQAHGIVPDMVTFAKGLGNGLAIGGVIAPAEVMDSLPANSISTFGGNPLSTAAALANLEYLLENDLQTNALKVGARLKAGLDEITDEVPEIAEVRGKGLMLGIEFADPETGEPLSALTNEVMERSKEEGLLIGKGGLFANTLRIAPPLSLTEEEADEGLEKLRAAIHKARQ